MFRPHSPFRPQARLISRIALFAVSTSLVFVACQNDTDPNDDGSGASGAGAGNTTGGNGGTPNGGAGGVTTSNGGGGMGGNADEMNCTDMIDNDGDTFIDCQDFDCCGDAACLDDPNCSEDTENDDTLCGNGIDDDGDLLTDCEDDSCHGHPNVTVCTETVCTGGTDEDLDGFTDCEDRDCWTDVVCADEIEGGVAECSGDTAMVDEDSDGNINCADFSCQATDPACVETNCTDGIDNDNDGFFDCGDANTPGEFDCINNGLCPASTGAESTDAECSDGIDNADSDTFVDCLDFSCQDSIIVTVCEGNPITCADGRDNDLNGFIDCKDFSCRCCPSEGDNCGTTARVESTCAPCAP